MTGWFPMNRPLTPPRRGLDTRTGLSSSPPGRGQGWVCRFQAAGLGSVNFLGAGAPREDAGEPLRSNRYDR